MSPVIYCRILGYTVTIVLHIANTITMLRSFHGDVMKDPGVRHFSEMQLFFFTCWTFTFQTVFAALSLHCDFLTVINAKKKKYSVPRILGVLRDEMFPVIVFPSSVVVFSFFWGFFYYDRNLFYPAYIDKAISPTSNHIMHTFILPVVLWEILVYRRTKPKSHIWRLLILFALEVIYISTLIYVYKTYGAWVYPIFAKLNNTIYFPLFFVITSGILVLFYHSQWYLNSLVWGTKQKISRKNL